MFVIRSVDELIKCLRESMDLATGEARSAHSKSGQQYAQGEIYAFARAIQLVESLKSE